MAPRFPSVTPRVLDLVDAGSGMIYGGFGHIDSTWCHREGCTEAPAAGHDFCPECLAWLRGDEDEDPLPNRPTAKAPSRTVEPQDDDDWYESLIGAIGGFS